MAKADIPLSIRVHTGTTKTFGAGDWGAVHTNRGSAGNIAYTLPDPTTIKAGTYAGDARSAASKSSIARS